MAYIKHPRWDEYVTEIQRLSKACDGRRPKFDLPFNYSNENFDVTMRYLRESTAETLDQDAAEYDNWCLQAGECRGSRMVCAREKKNKWVYVSAIGRSTATGRIFWAVGGGSSWMHADGYLNKFEGSRMDRNNCEQQWCGGGLHLPMRRQPGVRFVDELQWREDLGAWVERDELYQQTSQLWLALRTAVGRWGVELLSSSRSPYYSSGMVPWQIPEVEAALEAAFDAGTDESYTIVESNPPGKYWREAFANNEWWRKEQQEREAAGFTKQLEAMREHRIKSRARVEEAVAAKRFKEARSLAGPCLSEWRWWIIEAERAEAKRQSRWSEAKQSAWRKSRRLRGRKTLRVPEFIKRAGQAAQLTQQLQDT